MSKPQLIISQPGQRTRRVAIEKNLVSIGRKTDNTIALEGDTSVSKYHAVIELRADGFWLSDLDSRNGTTVNEQPVKTEHKLTSGDLICVGGKSTVEFLLPATGADAPPPDAPAAQPAAASSPQPQPTPAPPAPSPEAKPGGGSLMIVACVVGGLVLVGALVALLFAMGVLGGSSNKNSADNDARGPSARRRDDDDRSPDDAGAARSDDAGGVGDAGSPGNASAPPAPVDNSGASLPPLAGGGDSAATGDASSVEPLARTLAVQIAQKSLYSFDPAFVSLIKNYTNEYRTAAGYSERARKYRDAVDREFVNVQGIQPPLIGYVLAMSRSKFIEREAGGVWALPASVRSNAPDGAGDTAAADPAAASTRLAASYIKDLLDLFGRDQFMYAVACYGMTLDDAGRVKTELERRDPSGQMRYDFWKMKQAGVVRGEQVERVARFFAAGIVAENPQRFGLKDRPLSSLYDL